MLKVLLSSINVLEELRRIGITFHYASDSEVNVLCPFHEDEKPSCSINVEKRLFTCRSCDAHGDIITFLSRFLGVERDGMVLDLSSRYHVLEQRIVEPSVVEKWHSNIWEAGPLRKELYDRGVSDASIRRYRLGECKGRITIPITNEMGQFVNVRRYAPGAKEQKFTSMRGRGDMRLFPFDQLQYDNILICGGEIKAIAAAERLNSHGIGCIASTGGEGKWKKEFSKLLEHKTKVWVCFDIDKAGIEAANVVCAYLRRETHIIHLPLHPDEFPKGDINDYIAIGKALLPLLETAPVWVNEFALKQEELEEPEDIDLSSIMSASRVGKRVKFRALASMTSESPFFLPKQVCVKCDRDQKLCAICPILQMQDDPIVDINLTQKLTLQFAAANESTHQEIIRKSFNIPTCKNVEFEVIKFSRVDDCILTNPLELSNVSSDKITVRALSVDSPLELNNTYNLTGRMLPHPKTQIATLVATEAEAVQDQLSLFTLEDDDIHNLSVFQPDEWSIEALTAHLSHFYSDMSSIVTHIYERPDLHLIIDLAYHSALLMSIEGRDVKGWTEVLVLGDSAQGKSETALKLAEHYGLGEKVESKNATVAGLLGGLVKTSDKWFAQWGVIPTHDRRLVILEEIKGMPIEVLSKLTDMRSSGVAEIPKIERKKAHARTRLIALSNPRSGRQMTTFSHGVAAIVELIINPEDIRRFDAALIVASNEVSSEFLQATPSPNGSFKYSQILCRRLILWAWTLRSNQVDLSQVWEFIKERSRALTRDFSDAIPLIDKGSMRFKLARLAVALACRTFSTKDGHSVIVRKCHVQYIEEFLRRTYTRAAFGYDKFTKANQVYDQLKDPIKVSRHILALPFLEEFIEGALRNDKIDFQDIVDWSGWERGEATGLISFLVRNNALTREGKGYHKTSAFVALLQSIDVTQKVKESF